MQPVPHRRWWIGPPSVRHYLLTRSAYGPGIAIERNRRRLDLTRAICARSIMAQTNRDVTWLVLIDPEDAFLEERKEVFRSSGLDVMFQPAGDIVRDDVHDKPQGPWRDYLDWSGVTLTTRIDDDDAFAPWVLQVYRDKADGWARRHRPRPVVFVLPEGWRYAHGKVNRRSDRVSQFGSFFSPLGHRKTIMDMNHTGVRRLAPLVNASTEPAWLWVRHDATRSTHSRASTRDLDKMTDISDALRDVFPIDWSIL